MYKPSAYKRQLTVLHWFDWSTKWRKRFNHVTKGSNVTMQDQSSSFAVQILKEGIFKLIND